MTSRSVAFAGPVRTAIGTWRQSQGCAGAALGATAIPGAITGAGIRPDEVETETLH
jgi:hypothetical protein